MNSLILDSHGKPIKAIARSGQYSSQNRKFYATDIVPRYTNTNNDPYSFLNSGERKQINQYALDLFRSSPLIHAAITRKNEWAFADGWCPIFRGVDTAWGKKVSEWLESNVYPVCNMAGSNYDFNRTLVSIANQIDIAGDVLILWVIARDGTAKLAVYPSNMVGARDTTGIVASGRYKNASIDDGVILNSSQTPIAYHILQDNKADDYDIAIRDGQLLYEPNELCRRGVSVVAPSLLTLLHLDDITSFLHRTVKNDAREGIIVSTATGTGEQYLGTNFNPMTADLGTAPPQDSKFQPHIIDMGDYTFINAKNGEKIESFKSDRPHTNTVEWMKYVAEQCCADLRWPLGLISPSKLNGTAARMVESDVQQAISTRQATLKKIARIYTEFAIARGIENGEIPATNSADWRAWDWSLPAEFVIDSYYADQTDLAGLTAGTKTLQQVVSRNGGNWMEHREQRDKENLDAIARASFYVAAAKTAGQELSFERAMDLVGIGTRQNAAPATEQTINTGANE